MTKPGVWDAFRVALPHPTPLSELKINISRLSEGVHTFNLETESSSLELDDRFDHPIKVAATLDKSGKQFLLEAKIETDGQFSCDRCLEKFRRPVSAGYSLLYRQESPTSSEPEKEEIAYISPDTNMIDLGDDVRQFLLLALPIKILCREECKGLCASCGQNLNSARCSCSTEGTDPRWEVLRNISEH